MKPIGHDLTFA